jgi:hypothetical protein
MFNINGREVNRSLSKYLIDWEGKSLSNVQFLAKRFFYKFWCYDVVTEEFRIPNSRLSCDFLNWSKRYACEIDGNFHNKFSSYHHKNRMGFLGSIKRDSAKDDWLTKNRFVKMRIGEDDVKNLSPKWIKDNFDIDLI